MNEPSEALRNWLESNYTLAAEDVSVDDVKFTTVDYNTDRSPQCPHIVTQLSGFRRIQEGEPSLYEFSFVVQISVFQTWRKPQSDIAELTALYWAIVNHIKVVCDSFNVGDITGWQSVWVDSGTNTGILIGTIPDEFVFTLGVKAVVGWTS